MIVNTLGRKWEFTFTTLVTFGGAFFASFPLFYATSFGGAYWMWIAILVSFILQAVSYEFRSKPSNFLGKKTYEVFLIINGFLGPILIGTVVGTFFNGTYFILNEYNQVGWGTTWRGMEALLNFNNLALGFSVFFLARILALQYFLNSIDDEGITKNSKKQLKFNALLFLVFFLYFLVWILIKKGFSYENGTMLISEEKFKYFNNLIEMPLILYYLLLSCRCLVGYISCVYKTWERDMVYRYWNCTCCFCLLSLLDITIHVLSSVYDLNSSLNIRNSSSSEFTF